MFFFIRKSCRKRWTFFCVPPKSLQAIIFQFYVSEEKNAFYCVLDYVILLTILRWKITQCRWKFFFLNFPTDLEIISENPKNWKKIYKHKIRKRDVNRKSYIYAPGFVFPSVFRLNFIFSWGFILHCNNNSF